MKGWLVLTGYVLYLSFAAGAVLALGAWILH